MLSGGDDVMKRKVKWVVDILMTLALFFLMGYHFWGETAHEWAGAGMFVLFLAHQILNRGWYQRLFRGKYTLRASYNACPSGTGELRSSRYTPVRILMLAVNILTLTAMVLLMYSGITMSRHVFAFLPARGGKAASSVGFLLGIFTDEPAHWTALGHGME